MLAEMNAGEGQWVERRQSAHPEAAKRGVVVPQGWYLRWKPRLEWGVALLLVVPALPLVLLSALLVKLTSRGPAFYSQTRVGKNGRIYTIHKIRTMRHDAEHGTGPRWATAQDPRITCIGRFLRRSHLDELPQLWNVLRGEMALVGPRPERPEFVAQLAQTIPHYRERLQVLPGVTGLAQVELPPDTDLESVRRKLAHDLYYLQHIRCRLDLGIVLATACDLFGVPYWVSRALFPVPQQQVVEQLYEQLSHAGQTETVAQPA